MNEALRRVMTEAGGRFAAEEVTIPAAVRASDFGDVAAEVLAASESGVLLHLSGTAVIRLSGPDAGDYLHRMLTCAIKPLGVGEVRRGTVLKGDGRMIAEVTALRTSAQEFVILAPAVCRTALVAHFDKYLITEDVTLTDVTASHVVFQLVGPESRAGATAALGDDACLDVQPFQHCRRDFHNSSVLMVNLPFGQVPSILVLCDNSVAAELWQSLNEAIRAIGGRAAGESARHELRVKYGVPEFGIDMDESTIPLEAGLKTSIDFTKGCFPGQEIVARIENLGHPAKVLVQLEVEGLPSGGSELMAGDKVIGKITSLSQSGTPRLALATVKWDQRAAGTELQLCSGGQAKVVATFA